MPKISTYFDEVAAGAGGRPDRRAGPALLAVPAAAQPGAPAPAAPWTGAWATSPQRESGPAFADQTLRLLVHPTLGGAPLRIRLSNDFGDEAVTFGAVGVARAVAAGSPELVAGTSRQVTFRGRSTVTVPAGTHVFSDPVRLGVDYGQDLAVDLYVTDGGDAGAITGHDAAQGTQFVAAGDHAGAAAPRSPTRSTRGSGSTASTCGPRRPSRAASWRSATRSPTARTAPGTATTAGRTGSRHGCRRSPPAAGSACSTRASAATRSSPTAPTAAARAPASPP